ncbi:Fe-S cluster assembly sulfur transfer protein SufU [Sabulicella rubraurantiaca]|uniref:Fe-S cluster assembly sulfur transfer protein SufU n=1 Tax=Sabulicella rubraurantiaca TaxID=2811429 RepID=UPI001A975A66|nr:SUF system NifU family Fe-S cluster assembly protein [Sabulicella rubraurantiaca]
MNDLLELYPPEIRDHARQPRNRHRLECVDATARGDNPLCGDRVEVFLRLNDGRIAEASFMGRGCDVSQASASMLTGAVGGLVPDAALDLSEKVREMARSGAVPDDERFEALRSLAGAAKFPSRVKCATLAWVTLEAALRGGQEASSE